MAERSAVLLDRDGVINLADVRDWRPYSPASVADLEILPGVPEAPASFRAADLAIAVVINQPDVARGRQRRAECRKPAPGMLLAAAEERGIDVRSSVMVGDRSRDVEAGRRAGWFSSTMYAEPESQPDFRASSLIDATRWILQHAGMRNPT